MTTTAAERRTSFLALVRGDDILQTFRSTPDDVLFEFAAGLAIEAFEGRYTDARWQARQWFRIPEDACDLACAAYLATITPTMGSVILQRPSEGSLIALRQWLRGHGYKATRQPAHALTELQP